MPGVQRQMPHHGGLGRTARTAASYSGQRKPRCRILGAAFAHNANRFTPFPVSATSPGSWQPMVYKRVVYVKPGANVVLDTKAAVF
jgi:hypothetical protein